MIVKNEIEEILKNAFVKSGFDKDLVLCSYSSRPESCDYQCNSAFAVSKKYNINPKIVAETIIKNIESDDYEFLFSAPAFINIKINNNKLTMLANSINSSPSLLVEQTKTPQKILLDYGGANIAKELHIGHLRSPLIGESINRLLKLVGNTCVSDSHLGDWGLQMGTTIAQLEEDGYLDYYFGKSKVKKDITLESLNEEYPKGSKRIKVDEAFKDKVDSYTLLLQQKASPYYEIFKEIREISVKTISKNYAKLNCFFTYFYGESDADPYIERTVNIFKEKGLTRISEGALVVDVVREDDTEPMPPAILKKHNGGDLYATTDLATILLRNETEKPDTIIYVVDKRQELHFKQVFRAAKLSGISPANQKLVHIAYGTMNGTDGKPFKTRSGETIKLEDIISMLTTKAKEKLSQNGIENDDKLALQIGVASMKFGDLSNTYDKDYVFNIDKFCSFEGKTGPYLQYTSARIKSLLSKAEDKYDKIEITTNDERNIILCLLKLLDSYEFASKDYSLNTVCLAVYNLASSYATFYNNFKILTCEDSKKRKSALALSSLTLKAISQALDVLAIDIPDRM
ncbi:MAG: arginine--tRNA ligase [Clostridia bacterium]